MSLKDLLKGEVVKRAIENTRETDGSVENNDPRRPIAEEEWGRIRERVEGRFGRKEDE